MREEQSPTIIPVAFPEQYLIAGQELMAKKHQEQREREAAAAPKGLLLKVSDAMRSLFQRQ